MKKRYSTVLILTPVLLGILAIQNNRLFFHLFCWIMRLSIRTGSFTLRDYTNTNAASPNPDMYVFGTQPQPHSFLDVYNSTFYKDAVMSVDVGVGEAYVSGMWSSEDIEQLIRVVMLNRKNFQFVERVVTYLSPTYLSEYFWRNSFVHTRQEDQASISSHYDLGSKLFQLFLDDTMTYTSAMFPESNSTLYDAQLYKVDRVIQKARAKSSDTALDIGCGFGFLASRMANTTKAKVTGVTISSDQYEISKSRFTHDGVEYLFSDYRDVKDKFDVVVSVEMIEAIGLSQLPVFWKKLAELTKNDGRVVLQYSASTPWFYTDADLKGGAMVTFVTKHIFPGGFIPFESDVHEEAFKAGFESIHVEKFGHHYARTLDLWLARMRKHRAAIVEIYDEKLFRTFEYYLAWSQALYRSEWLTVVQHVFQKTEFVGKHSSSAAL